MCQRERKEYGQKHLCSHASLHLDMYGPKPYTLDPLHLRIKCMIYIYLSIHRELKVSQNKGTSI